MRLPWFGRERSGTSLAQWQRQPDLSNLRKRVRIVVIDDDSQAFPTETLRREGYAIDHWERVESLDKLERGDYDIIVLDIGGVAGHLSDADGLGVLQHLKARNPAQVIVAFSGQAFDLGAQRFFRLADDTLPKPASALKCKQVIDHLIETRLTVPHLWAGIEDLLRREGVSQQGIRSVDEAIQRALQKGKPGMKPIVERVVKRANVALEIASMAEKLITLFGK